MNRKTLIGAAVSGGVLAFALFVHVYPAFAQHGAAPVHGGATINLQARQGDTPMDTPQAHELYGLSVMAFAHGPDNIDFETYEAQSFEIVRVMAGTMGLEPEGLVDHVQDIPRQIVGIVRDDPSVLDSFEDFRRALQGPP